MTLREELQDLALAPQRRFDANVKALERLRNDGHKVEAKSPEAVFVDDRYMVFVYENRYHDIDTNTHHEFDNLEVLFAAK